MRLQDGCARPAASQPEPRWPLGRAASTRTVATSGVAWQAVIGDRLPRRRGGHELTDARPDAGIVVKGAHPDTDRICVAGIAAKERRATVATEPLLAAAVRLPCTEPILACNDPKGARCRMRICRCRRSAATLAALAMAIAGDNQRRGHLESDGAAVAATGQDEVRHLWNCLSRNGACRWQEDYGGGTPTRRRAMRRPGIPAVTANGAPTRVGASPPPRRPRAALAPWGRLGWEPSTDGRRWPGQRGSSHASTAVRRELPPCATAFVEGVLLITSLSHDRLRDRLERQLLLTSNVSSPSPTATGQRSLQQRIARQHIDSATERP